MFVQKHDKKIFALARMKKVFDEAAQLIEAGADISKVCTANSDAFTALMMAAKGTGAIKAENALVVHAIAEELER
jgi:hypothetical protein